jgi:hypothetical protein
MNQRNQNTIAKLHNMQHLTVDTDELNRFLLVHTRINHRINLKTMKPLVFILSLVKLLILRRGSLSPDQMLKRRMVYRPLLWAIIAAWGLVPLTNVQLQAQTLPVTSGLQLWLKADVGITTNASGQVSAWADQSGFGNNAVQTAPASSPTVALNSLNGHATLRVSGSQFMEVPSVGAIATLTDNVTILTVIKHDNLTGYRCVLTKGVASLPAPFDWWNNSSQNGGLTALYLGNGTQTYTRYNSTVVPPVGVYNVMGFRWTGGVVDETLNDFNAGHFVGMPITADGGTPLRIGRRIDAVTQLLGNIAEILIYQPALSDSNMSSVITNYLQPKYALAFDIAPAVSITSPTNGTTVATGSIIPVSISVSDADGYVRTVGVFGNGALLATATATATNSSATYQLNVSALGQGPLTLTAVATDNYGRPVTSTPVLLNITAAFPSAPVTSGLKVWLAADSGVTTNLSGAITNWTDQSGSGNDAVQTDETVAPLVVADAVNGKPVLRFSSATPHFLEVSEPGTAFTTSNFTTFTVARFVGSYPARRQNVWSKCGGGVAGPVDWAFTTDTGVPFGLRGDGTISTGTGSGLRAPVLGEYTTVGMTVTAADGVMAHQLGFLSNGVSTAAINTASAGPLRIGRRADGANQINGDIAEILIYDQALSTSDGSNVVAYLSGKYAIAQATYADPAPIVNITGPTNGSTFVAPATVTFAATVSVSSNAALVRVTLSANGTTFVTLTNAPFEIPLDLQTPGNVTFTAVATDSWGVQTTASVVATVTGGAGAPPVTNGLQLWLAADLGVTTNGAGNVTAWVDQSLNGRDAAPTAISTSPLQIPNVLNGKPVLRFNGGSPGQFLEVAADTSFTAGDISTFAIVKFNNFSTAPAYRNIWTKTANNSLPSPVDWYFATGTGAANVYRGNGSSSGSAGFAGGTAPAGLFTIVGFKASGQTISHYRNYDVTAVGSIAKTPVNLGFPMRIGRRFDSVVQMNGDIAEFLIYDRAVSEEERLQIVNYLNNKWGITVVQVHNQPPSVALISPTNGTPASAPGVLSLVAQATDADSTITRVDFVANGSVVASRTAPPYQIPLQVLSPGPVTLQARAVDFYGAIGTSAPVTLTITGTGPAAPPSAGQVLWLKANAGVTTNIDGTVATWADQSGSGNNAAQDLSGGFSSPLLVTDDVTGQPVLKFDYDSVQSTGLIRYLVVEHSPSLALVNDWSLFYVASFDDFASTRSILGKTSITLPHPFDYSVNTAARAQVTRGSSLSSTIISTGALPTNTYVIGGVTVASGGHVTHYRQGFSNGTGDFLQQAVDDGGRLVIGSRDALDIFFKGNLGEILLYDRALAGTNLQLINNYLAGRFGIAAFQLSTQPPSLNVAQTGPGTVQLSWLPGYAGFVLEGRTNLANASWIPVATNPPNNQVTIGTTNATRFFRLRSQ